MEIIKFNNDIKVFYITAQSFPEGVLAAHQTLHKLIPFSPDRKYFGVSRPENGQIVYRATTEETYPGEAEKLNLDTLILKKGNYISQVIKDYQKDIPSISRTFDELLKHPDIDPEGYCVEWYISMTDVNCLVRLNK
ncbi:MAG TPA: hypothetical protein VL490_04650 [Mucilaginibacter sp.]|jgi:hypothetical protein|nr:hypothetical protein [Mucilaginibacter sp.]